MEIKWLGHSCFKITHEGYSIVLDPYYPDMIPGLGALDLKANQVLCSHQHDDHNYVKAVQLETTAKPNPFIIERIRSFHDAFQGAKRGINFLSVLSASGFRIAHLGDLGCELTKEQTRKLQGLDALLVPVGGHFTIGPEEAKRLCDQIQPKIIIPMHFRSKNVGFSALETVDAFTKLFPDTKIIQYATNLIKIDAEQVKQIALLRFK